MKIVVHEPIAVGHSSARTKTNGVRKATKRLTNGILLFLPGHPAGRPGVLHINALYLVISLYYFVETGEAIVFVSLYFNLLENVVTYAGAGWFLHMSYKLSC